MTLTLGALSLGTGSLGAPTRDLAQREPAQRDGRVMLSDPPAVRVLRSGRTMLRD